MWCGEAQRIAVRVCGLESRSVARVARFKRSNRGRVCVEHGGDGLSPFLHPSTTQWVTESPQT